MAFTQPLDLYNLLVVTLAGNATIFLFVTGIIFSIIATKYRMPVFVFGTLMLTYAGIFGIYYGDWFVGGIIIMSIILTALITRSVTRT